MKDSCPIKQTEQVQIHSPSTASLSWMAFDAAAYSVFWDASPGIFLPSSVGAIDPTEVEPQGRKPS